MKHLKAWLERANQRTPRERALFGGTALVLAVALADLLVFAPLAAERERVHSELTARQTEVATARAREAELAGALARRDETTGPAAAARLDREIARLDELVRERSQATISPVQMVAVLREMFADDNAVTLDAIENAPPIGLRAPGRTREDGPALVYRHPLSVEFTGNYAKILEYVKRIEALPWQLIWDDISIVMEKYPRARARIVLHTLSLAEEWIGA